MIFDTHAHYDDKAFDEDRDSLLMSLPESGIGAVIDPGCTLESSAKAQLISSKYAFVYFAAGVHPEEINALDPDYISKIGSFASDDKFVAIGEIGLDYYWDASQKEKQKKIFRAQMELAEKLDKPVIIHDREAHADTFEIISDFPDVRGVFHCYSGSAEMARELLARGWYLGFDGPVTYKNARKTIEVLNITPADRILIETDSPYMAPVPVRGSRNDSRNLKYVLERISEIKEISYEKAEQITFENARRLFRIR